MRGFVVSAQRIAGSITLSLVLTLATFKGGVLRLLLPEALSAQLVPDFAVMPAFEGWGVICLHLFGWALVAEGVRIGWATLRKWEQRHEADA